jgi:hypothetical protein
LSARIYPRGMAVPYGAPYAVLYLNTRYRLDTRYSSSTGRRYNTGSESGLELKPDLAANSQIRSSSDSGWCSLGDGLDSCSFGLARDSKNEEQVTSQRIPKMETIARTFGLRLGHARAGSPSSPNHGYESAAACSCCSFLAFRPALAPS